MSGAAPRTPGAVLENIQSVIRVEEGIRGQRSGKERVADAIGSFAGTVTFVLLHLLWFVIWVVVNTKLIPGLPAFDPYPFQLLAMIVSLEGVLLSTFVLIKQNRMTLASDRRGHLDLQINLLTEQEVTKLLQLMERVSGHLGLATDDAAIVELREETAVDELAKELDQKMPEQE